MGRLEAAGCGPLGAPGFAACVPQAPAAHFQRQPGAARDSPCALGCVAMENQVLTPHVYWAQRHRELYLRVELSDVQVKAGSGRRDERRVGGSQGSPGATQIPWSFVRVPAGEPAVRRRDLGLGALTASSVG